MVTDVVEAATELTVARKALWDLLVDPDTYPRVFPGIGACEHLGADGGPPLVRMRLGGGAGDIHTVDVRLVPGRPGELLELQCPGQGSFASVRLRGDAERTRVNVTYFAPARAHPLIPALSNEDVIDWTVAALDRLADLATGAPTSMVINGEDSPRRLQVDVARQMLATGVVRSYRFDKGVKQLGRLAKWGFTLAGGYAAAAAYDPHRTALIDDRGGRTFAEIHQRTHALAGALADLDIRAGDAIGLLSRNHIEMVEIMVAAGKLGVDVVLLNTGLAAGRIAEIAEKHELAAVFADPELEDLIRYLPPDLPRYAASDYLAEPGRATVDDLIDVGGRGFGKPPRTGTLIVLTSGTSGTPKGARRPHPKGFGTVAALLSRIPLRMNETMLIPAPLFHTWGLAALQISTPIRATVVLTERFDAEDCLRIIDEQQVTSLIVVPIMVNRILDLPAEVRARYDTSSLRVVASCGAPLAGAAVLRFTELFGDVLYNVYGSTEVSWATIADPADLRISPTTAGRPPLGTKVAVLGPDSRPVPVGATGRIFVGNHMLFDGYTDAAPPGEADGMLDTGDVGYLDASGRLFVAGRDDEMIISGGENVFPRPVEEALSHLPQVSEVAVVGVPDREFGQRLAAFVVKRPDSGLDPDMIRTYIRNRLGRFSVPRDVHFLDALPRNPTGKILKRTLVQSS
ncbi:acyl-CoA synthetase (AMP-forming)/AMP-acid ligase II [Nocardia transvalensis]|uniref:Acyl-CoA synthetase (AMP-forming)/AMP-acid ligase II n=1 Tax=Nocardia transvalensis TaxID=37333 RepID=A0A7W9PF80_9NOCA|nr:AMP-binding protein [Nocardia transvalensis]MBB5914960.1 acyl-CoA synthetase (AMP-forming)/AMP-acid ligase II [Nocardia transvalensis]